MTRLAESANCILIEEVKKRPCLFIRGHPRYNDIVHKRIMWDEIAEKVFKQHWTTGNKRDKENMVDTLLTRWKSLRTCFSREIKTQMRFQKYYGRAIEHKREYRYYNDLMFLKPHLEALKSEESAPIDLSDDEEDAPPAKLKTYSRRPIKTQESEKHNKTAVSKKITAINTITTSGKGPLPSCSSDNSERTSLIVDPLARTIKIERSSDVDNSVQPSNTVDRLNSIKSPDEITIIKAESPVKDLFETTEPAICAKISSIITNSSVRNIENWESFLLSLKPMLEVLPAHKVKDAKIAILTAVKQCLLDNSDTNDDTSNMADQDGGSGSQNNGGTTTSIKEDIKREQSSDDDEDMISLNQV